MATITLTLDNGRYFAFRQWLKARDPPAVIHVEAGPEHGWIVRADVTKPYLQDVAVRRWGSVEGD